MLSRRRRSGERGAVLVFVAPLFLAIFAVTALVVDLGNARQEARHVQGSVDAGSLAGARELPLAAASTTAATRAKQQVAKNVNINITGSSVIPGAVTCSGSVPANSTCYSIGNAEVVVATPYLDAPSGAPASFNLVFVRVCRPTATFFASTIGATSPEVCRDAVGRRVSSSGGYPMGLVVIDPTACNALEFAGSSATVLSSNGAVMVNSNCTTNALDASGSAWRVDASYIGVVGEAALAPCEPPSTCSSTVPTENISPFDDPFAHVVPPDPSLIPNSGTHSCSPSTGTRVMQPGRYPTNCGFNNTAGYIFRPGVYYFENGFSTGGNAPLVCDGTATDFPVATPSCTTTVTNADGTTTTTQGVTFIVGGGAVTMNGTAKVSLPAPTSGPYAGISLYQLSASTSTINGTNDFLLGTIYAPNAEFKFTGSGGGSNAINIEGMVVTKTAEISGSFYFNINVPPHSPEAKIEDDFGLWE